MSLFSSAPNPTVRPMLDIQAIITGDAALQAKFEALGTKGSDRAMRLASRVGTKALAIAIKSAIPEAKTPKHNMNHVRSRVGTRVKSNRASGLTHSKVGFDVGKKRVPRAKPAEARSRTKGATRKRRVVNRAPHAHLLAAGTGLRRTRLTRANRGRIGPGRYIPRAVASSASAVGALMESTLRAEIYKDATK